MCTNTNEIPCENIEQSNSSSEAVLVLYGYLSESTNFTLDEIRFNIEVLLIYLEEIHNVTRENLQVSKEAGHIYINDGVNFIAVGERFFLVGLSTEEKMGEIEKVSFDESAARYQESISYFRESVVELDILLDAINAALEKNDNETWEVIDEDDIILEGPFRGKTLVEAILIYKRKIGDSSNNLRNLGNFNTETHPEISEAREKLYDANEQYLLLSLGIGEKREELTHVIPKSQSECITLIRGVVMRRNPRQILDWMKEIHTQIDSNNWQDGTVEKNYRFFSENLNTIALAKIKADIYENEESENYRDPNLLLEFAVLVSGRAAWNREAGLFMNDIGENASPVDSRLWMPEIAEEALVYAMDIPKENENGETQSMISEMMTHLEISDSLIGAQTPSEAVNTTIDLIKQGVYFENSQSGGQTSLGESEDFDKVIEGLGYNKIVEKATNGDLEDDYQKLSLEEMISISSMIRISRKIRRTTTEVFPLMLDEPYIPNEGEEILEHREIQTLFGIKYHYRVRKNSGNRVSIGDFQNIASEAAQESVEHVGNELDKNFDDTWSEIWDNINNSDFRDEYGNLNHNRLNEARAEKFGITNPNSIEYQIFTLYNDINGNGHLGEVSDTTREGLKTAGYMLAMVAGAVILGGGIAGILGVTSVIAQGAIMGATGSALGYGIDTVSGDARGFYTPSEAITGIGSDFVVGAGTGALGGVMVKAWGAEGVRFFTRGNAINKGIFAGDLAVLGLGSEYLRMESVNRAWHGHEIFTQGENPIAGKIDTINRRLISNPSDEVWQAYLDNPRSEGVSPYLQDYRITYEVFPMIGMEELNIPIEFDRRLQKALATYLLLNPGGSINIFHEMEPEFHEIGRVRDYDSHEDFLQAIYEATEKWISRQENRLSEII